MQNTRLNTLIDSIFQRINQTLRNPWRRLSLLAIGLLFGFFLGSAISTIAGQLARLDTSVAALLVLVTEIVSWLVYRRNKPSTPLMETFNALKIGLIYSLYLEALKLGS